MLYLTISLFAVAAILGILIFKNWLTAAETSRGVIYGHGIFAATALVLLVVIALQSGASALRTSVILFVIAALGGIYMFLRDLRGKFSPMWLATVHALLAVAGFLVLIFYVV
jgi:hypothetical protein